MMLLCSVEDECPKLMEQYGFNCVYICICTYIYAYITRILPTYQCYCISTCMNPHCLNYKSIRTHNLSFVWTCLCMHYATYWRFSDIGFVIRALCRHPFPLWLFWGGPRLNFAILLPLQSSFLSSPFIFFLWNARFFLQPVWSADAIFVEIYKMIRCLWATVIYDYVIIRGTIDNSDYLRMLNPNWCRSSCDRD